MFYVSVSARHLKLLGIGLVMFAMTAAASAGGNVAAGKKKAAASACAGCHGQDGNGTGPGFPRLAGQHEKYLTAQLQAFKLDSRSDNGSGMSAMAKSLSNKDIENIAAYYASLPPKAGVATADVVRKGELIYRGGNVNTGVSACMSCHGPSGHGIPPRFPRISGQSAAYTNAQLLAFKSGKRTSDGDIMTRIAFRMSEGEIAAVSEYMAGLH